MKKIAVYAYNFGNFRNELYKKGGIDNFKKYKEFDYFFYTDNNIKSKKWKVIKVPLIKKEKNEIIDSFRKTAKYYKWYHFPNELKKYKYILHVDCSKVKLLTKLTPSKINKIINNNPNTLFFCRKHPCRNNIYEEANIVKKVKKDTPKYVNNYIKKLKSKKFNDKFNLIETNIFLKKNNSKTNKIFQKVYKCLMKYKLKRDQLVFTYILQKYNLNELKYEYIFSRKELR